MVELVDTRDLKLNLSLKYLQTTDYLRILHLKKFECTEGNLGCRTFLIKQFNKMDRFSDLLQQMEKTLLTEMTYGKCTDAENSL